jgi:arginyl-tRNA synthetase
MVRDELAALTYQAVKKAQKKGDLPKTDIPDIVITRPRQAQRGDYSSSQPLQMIAAVNTTLKAAGHRPLTPVELGQRIVHRLAKAPFIAQVEVSPPGFLNFTLDDGWLAQQVETILAAGDTFGNVDRGHGRRVQVEFGSANPTGPLHVGFGRNVVLGDTLANLLAAGGYQVQREYYINDAGTQIGKFGESLYVRYCQHLGQDAGDLPEGGYHGQYVADWAGQIAAKEGDRYLAMPRDEAVKLMTEIGREMVLESVRRDVVAMNVHYDNWFSERSLYQEGVFDQIMTILREGDHLFMAGGAVWFNAEALGADKNEVIIRSNGLPGYFASDISYHYNKFVQRGFDWVIDVWGADHHGHVPRMKAMMRALGLDPERLTLYLYQLVTLLESGEQVRLSKRAGTQVDLREVMDDIGPDALRFFLLARAADSQMDLDLDLARKESSENPVYYVQYGHARIASILRYAEEQGHTAEGADVSLLTHPAELALIRKMLELPEAVAQAVETLACHHLPHYAQELAAVFHIFYRDCRVVSSEPADGELTKARLRLAQAAKLALGRTLALMGVSAPERM